MQGRPQGLAKTPSDFRPQGHPPADPSRAGSQSIGFQELRQAWEISTLREDLERIVQDTEALRDNIEDAVERVRNRFASLTAEELADSEKMAPLLQFAVSSLLDIRDSARRINTQTGPVADEDRPSWAAAESPRLRPTPPVHPPSFQPPSFQPMTASPPMPPASPQAAPPPRAMQQPAPPAPPRQAEPPSPPTLSALSPVAPAVYAAPPPPAGEAPPASSTSWLSPLSAARKPGGRNGAGSGPAKTIDWLSRPDR